MNITEPAPQNKFSIFAYGFRPFFLLAGIYAILPIIPWMLFLSGHLETDIDIQKWHAHEMFFGFVLAAISGFLLTAVPNWTGAPRVKGGKLKLLVALWLLGRAVFWLVLFVDASFVKYLLFLDLLLIIILGLFTSQAIIFSGNKRNFIIIFILSILAIANFLIILEQSGLAQNIADIGVLLASNAILLMLAVISGRVTPNFTRSYFRGRNIEIVIRTFPIIEVSAILLLVINLVVDLIVPHSLTSSLVALAACFVHIVRFSFWQTLKTLKEPIVWVLHLGYIWIIIALFLKSMELFIELPYNFYIHAFTLGAVGTYILGIMSRASLGHTGRPLVVGKIIITAYIIISFSAIVRLITPIFGGEIFIFGMAAAFILWGLGFVLYLWIYVPILTSPRIDGKAG